MAGRKAHGFVILYRVLADLQVQKPYTRATWDCGTTKQSPQCVTAISSALKTMCSEKIMDCVDRGVGVRFIEPKVTYFGFVDMSGGSNDDATLGIAHRDKDGIVWLDRIVDQGQKPPFDPNKAVEKFGPVLKEYNIRSITLDNYAGETFKAQFQRLGVSCRVSELSKSEIYEELEPLLNGGRVVLLDQPKLESQLLALVWRANRIDHPNGEHDDWANAAAGAFYLANKHKVYNPLAVPIGVGRVERPFGSSLGPRNTEMERPRTRIPIPIGVGDTGISLGGDRDDDYYVNGVRLRER